MKLINKDALVAEIERLKERFIAFHHRDGNDWPLDNYGKMRAYNELLCFLDTLEVKEVDLERYYNEYFKGWTDYQGIDSSVTDQVGRCVTLDDIKDACRYFFALGLKARQG